MSGNNQDKNQKKNPEGQLQYILRSMVAAARKNRGMITRDQMEKALAELKLSEDQKKLGED